MTNYTIIKKTIEEKFTGSDRERLLQIWTNNMIEAIEYSQYVMKEFYKNIITQAALTDTHKKILSYFFNITIEQNLILLAAIQNDEGLNPQEVYNAYITVLGQRTLTATDQFVEKLYFPKQIKWLLKNQDLLGQMDSFVDECFEKRPMAKSTTKHLYKNKTFHKEFMKIYIQKHREIAAEVMHIDKNTILNQKMKKNPSEWVIVNFFAHEVLKFCDEAVHDKYLGKMLLLEIRKRIKASHEEREAIQKSQKKNSTTKIGSKSNASNTPPQERKTSQKISPQEEFDQIYAAFKQEAQEKLDTRLDEIETYIRRMFKKSPKGTVHICTILKMIGEGYEEEVIEFVRKLCKNLDMPIKELDDTLEELEIIKEGAKDIVEWKEDTEKWNDNSHEAWYNNPEWDTQVNQISTLEKFKTQPELLQAEDIISIFQERWRRIVNPRKFNKQLETLVTNNGKLFDWRRKKLIEYLSWDQAVVGKKEIVRYIIGQYRILKFPDNNNPPRIIRKWNQILSCINHDEYDKLLLMMKKNADIDHLL